MKNIIILVIAICGFCVPSFAQSVPSSNAEIKLSFAPIVKKVAPSVVNIYAKRLVKTRQRVSPFMGDPFFNQFFGGGFGRGFGMPRERIESSLGSGVIIQKDGLVITNAHVVKDAVEAVIVLNDGREFDAEISLIDEASDLAVLKVEAKNLPYANIKPSETLEVGDLVLAIGNPFGVGQTVTSGIVSALARSTLDINDFNFFIQTDAAINPGNSGGPLVDMGGNVVGINTAIYSRDGGSLGIGFSVPSEIVQTIINAEKSGIKDENGNIKRPWLGISTQNVTSDIAQSMGMSRPIGSLISDIHEASPLAKSGVKVGDVVIKVNNKQVRDAAEMHFRLMTVPIGEKVKVTFLRGDSEKTINIKMIAPPDIPARQKIEIKGNNIFQGAHVCNMNPSLQEELEGLISNELPDNGVVVCDINNNAYARRVVRLGDILLEINGNKISNPKDVKKAASLVSSKGLNMTLIRNGQKQILSLR